MKLYKLEEMYFIYNIISKKIYIEDARNNDTFKIFLIQDVLHNFSIQDSDNCRWKKFYKYDDFKIVGQEEFQKLLLERFK